MSEPVVIVGGGKMGEALLGGLIRSGRSPSSLSVVEKDPARRADVSARYPGVSVAGTPGEVASPDVVIAVKPADVQTACAELAATGAAKRVLSIAAGVEIASLRDWLGASDSVAVLRAMTNTPALVGAAASAIAPGPHGGPADVAWGRSILESVGVVVTVGEADLDAVTGLSGSGPAYVFLLAEAFTDAGVEAGLPRSVARDLAVQTLLGSARLLAETGQDAAVLREAVTSPKGTTEAGLRALASAGFKAAVASAVIAGTERSREIAGGG